MKFRLWNNEGKYVFSKKLPKGLVYHGTSNAGAKRILGRGWKPSGYNDPAGMGVGSYQTPTYKAAVQYGTSKGNGWQVGAETSTAANAHTAHTGASSRKGKVIGQVLMSKPKTGAKPITSRGSGIAAESLWKPQDLNIVGTQNINRTSAIRAERGNPEYKELVRRRKQEATPPVSTDALKAKLKASAAARSKKIMQQDASVWN